MNEKKRLDWIDVAKAICILFVVLFHIDFVSKYNGINNTWKYIGKLAGIFEVTVFYCIAGLTLNNDKIKKMLDFLKHKFYKLYLKVVIIGIIAILFHNVFIKIGFYSTNIIYAGKSMFVYNISDIIKNIIMTVFLANREVILGAMWFVYTLILDFVLLSFIDKLIEYISIIKEKRKSRLLVSFVLMNFSIFFSSILNITIPRLNNTLVGLFLIDYSNYIYTSKKMEFNNMYMFIVCLILSLMSGFYGSIGMNDNIIPNPIFLIGYVSCFAYVIFFISKKISRLKYNRIIKLVGRESFSIMSFHFIGFKIGAIILNLIGYNTLTGKLTPCAENIFFVIYYMFFAIITSLLISFLLNKIFKFKL